MITSTNKEAYPNTLIVILGHDEGRSSFEEKEDVAAVVSTWDELKTAVESGKQGNIVIYGNIEAQDTVTLKAGQNLVGVGYYGIEEPDVDKFSQLNFDLETIGKTEAIKTDADNLTIADLSIKILTRQKTGSIAINLENSKYQILRNIDIFDLNAIFISSCLRLYSIIITEMFCNLRNFSPEAPVY